MTAVVRVDGNPERALATAQGAVWVVTGLWPIIHMRSFEAVTGPKPEGWLTKTAGLLIAVIGCELVRSARERPSVSLGVMGAASVAVIDVVYAARRRISPVYFGDAVLQTGFVAAWCLAIRNRKRS
jgi:hypothetical protein